MLGKLTDWNDTIVALATPQGVGAIGVVRVSGLEAIHIVNSLFPSKDLVAQPSHTLHVGLLKQDKVAIDQVVVSLYKSPASYTGEDVVEISSHGSPFILEKIIAAIAAKGARLAKPGEFTQRAFLNGKLDLAQAEAVADLIISNTEASRKTALQNIRGGFSQVLKELRDQLLSFSALIELELDFSQEDVEFADRKQFYELIEKAKQITQDLLSSFSLGNVIKNGVSVAIIGKPNAGKSTLLNTLLNENRAIVSEIAGTTRDTIEEVLNIDGILFRLIDTAGIRHSKGDVIEDIGMSRAKQNAEQADIIIHLTDITSEDDDTIDWLDNFKDNVIEVANKFDSAWNDYINKKGNVVDLADGIYISAKENVGIDALKKILYEKVVDGTVNTESTIVTNARHYEALRLVNEAVEDILNGLNNNIPADLIALDIRRCLHYLGEITGEITNEDQLDYIFSKFCIGK